MDNQIHKNDLKCVKKIKKQFQSRNYLEKNEKRLLKTKAKQTFDGETVCSIYRGQFNNRRR